MSDDTEKQEQQIAHDWRLYRRGYSDGIVDGASWGYVIGLVIGGLVVYALKEHGVTWLR